MEKEYKRLLKVIELGCYFYMFINKITLRLFEDKLLKRYEYECRLEINKLYG